MENVFKKKAASLLPTRKTKKHGTSMTFSSEELASLAELVAAGQVLLRRADTPRSVVLLKAAMSRLHVPIPKGL